MHSLLDMDYHLSTVRIGTENFDRPIDDRWFEDYRVGAVYEYGHVEITQAQIVHYANIYDPQSIHTNPTSAEDGPFGGLIASGWQTAGVFMRIFVDHYLTAVGSLASPGIDELRWTAPVRPGDRLWVRITVEGKRLSSSKPDRGLVHTIGEMFNQGDTKVLSLRAMNMIAVRPPRIG